MELYLKKGTIMENYKLYSVSEAAKLIGVSRQTVLNWIKSGNINSIQPNKHYRISKEEIERILNFRNKYINSKYLSEILGVSSQTIWNWNKKGVINSINKGKKIFFNKEEIIEKFGLHEYFNDNL